jgi:exodeoxyribonuclease-1
VGVLGQADGWKRLGLDVDTVSKHQKILRENKAFIDTATELLNQKPEYPALPEAENQLYDGFVPQRDKLRMEAVRNATREELKQLDPMFDDTRLAAMLPRYKAYNFSSSLGDAERAAYEAYRTARISRQAPAFLKNLQTLAANDSLSDHQQFVLEELKLWYESIVPVEEVYD